MEVPGLHHVMSLFSRTGFLFFHSIYGYFKNIYCEGGGNKAQNGEIQGIIISIEGRLDRGKDMWVS